MDRRTDFEKLLDAKVGLPLYYCDQCKRAVKVTAVQGADPVIKRPCVDACDAPIIAPRKSILAGEGGLNFKERAQLGWWQLAALLTGRCV